MVLVGPGCSLVVSYGLYGILLSCVGFEGFGFEDLKVDDSRRSKVFLRTTKTPQEDLQPP